MGLLLSLDCRETIGLFIALSDDCRGRPLKLDVGVISCSFLPTSELLSVLEAERRFGRQQHLSPTRGAAAFIRLKTKRL